MPSRGVPSDTFPGGLSSFLGSSSPVLKDLLGRIGQTHGPAENSENTLPPQQQSSSKGKGKGKERAHEPESSLTATTSDRIDDNATLPAQSAEAVPSTSESVSPVAAPEHPSSWRPKEDGDFMDVAQLARDCVHDAATLEEFISILIADDTTAVDNVETRAMMRDAVKQMIEYAPLPITYGLKDKMLDKFQHELSAEVHDLADEYEREEKAYVEKNGIDELGEAFSFEVDVQHHLLNCIVPNCRVCKNLELPMK